MSAVLKKAKNDMIDLESITRNLDREYKPANIELTSYEKQQEESAIISYDELVKNAKNKTANYDDNYSSNADIDIKKINLDSNSGTKITDTKINSIMMNYEVEEEFLKALKQLKIDLAR